MDAGCVAGNDTSVSEVERAVAEWRNIDQMAFITNAQKSRAISSVCPVMRGACRGNIAKVVLLVDGRGRHGTAKTTQTASYSRCLCSTKLEKACLSQVRRKPYFRLNSDGVATSYLSSRVRCLFSRVPTIPSLRDGRSRAPAATYHQEYMNHFGRVREMATLLLPVRL